MPAAFIPLWKLEGRLERLRERRERESREGEIAEKDTSESDEEEGRPIKDELYKAICDDDWESAKTLLEKQPNALKSKITASGKTPFHVAALFGHVSIMKELVKQLEDPHFLETVDDLGNTPLLIAAATGNIQVANCLVKMNSKQLAIPNSADELPTTLAFLSGHHEMGRYLYSLTPLECLKPHKDHQGGPTLLRCCFETQCLDIVLHLLNWCEELLFASGVNYWRPIDSIATMNSTIPSPDELVFWKRWIYDYTNSTPSSAFACLPIRQHEGTRERARGKLTRPVAAGHRLLQYLISSAYNVIGIKKIKEMKLLQAQAYNIVQLACKNARRKDQMDYFAKAVFLAVKEGNVEFVVQISKANPEILLVGDVLSRNIIYLAIQHRQARVFNLIHGLRFKDLFATSKDKDGNTLLHAAAEIAPDIILNRIYAPTLQMQRELQWFKEAESLMPPTFRKLRNIFVMTAEESFRENHKELMKQGEKWVKATASSCSVVGTLIVTIMFAAAFTVPGGNEQNLGYPLFIKQPFFKVFIFSTILSLLSSSTSVLMFLAIITSQYSEEKFLKSLPTKLILGLSFLFIAIVTMIIAFLSTIHLLLKHTNYSWGLLPVILIASVPIFLFVLSQFPLLLHTYVSTYVNIFDKKVEPWP